MPVRAWPVVGLAKGVLKVVNNGLAEVADEVADDSTGFGEGTAGLHPGLTLRLLSRSLALSLCGSRNTRSRPLTLAAIAAELFPSFW